MVKNLRKLRIQRGISQQLLADIIGTSQQSINKYENHSVEPDINTLIKIADYFCVTIDYLVGRTPHTDSAEKELDMSRDELLLLRSYRSLTKNEKESIRLICRNYLKGRPAPEE